MQKPVVSLAALGLLGSSALAHAEETPLAVDSPGITPSQALEVRSEAKRMRPVVTSIRPKSVGQSPAEVARSELSRALFDNLARAKERAAEADFAGCVEHAGRALGGADKIVGELGAFDLLRDLHVEIGVCLALDGRKESALVHFTSATLLDEAAPKSGLYRSEAEAVREQARQAVLTRSEGVVRIQTDPPGAKVSIDGRELSGVTPLDVHVRLGDHFVTFR
ncbi:MAG: PEGA domain-containing protein, partial [Myxococcales bacterium]|nr:PEGA domain-containing protein [Myxococcales bacterium]